MTRLLRAPRSRPPLPQADRATFLPACTPPATTTFRPIPTPTATLPIPRAASSSSRPRARRARRSSWRSGLQLDTLLEREHGAEIRALGRLGQGIRHRGGHRHRQDARHPPDRRVDPAGAARGRRGEPGARGDAGDAELERGHRHHRHRAPLVPGRSHHRPRHHHRGRDPPDLGRAGAVPGAGQAGRLPLHLAQRDGGSRPSTPATSTAPRCSQTYAFDPKLKAKVAGAAAEARGVPQRALRPARDQGAARRRGLRADPRGGRAAGGRSWASSGRGSPPRSITAASRSG